MLNIYTIKGHVRARQPALCERNIPETTEEKSIKNLYTHYVILRNKLMGRQYGLTQASALPFVGMKGNTLHGLSADGNLSKTHYAVYLFAFKYLFAHNYKLALESYMVTSKAMDHEV